MCSGGSGEGGWRGRRGGGGAREQADGTGRGAARGTRCFTFGRALDVASRREVCTSRDNHNRRSLSSALRARQLAFRPAASPALAHGPRRGLLDRASSGLYLCLRLSSWRDAWRDLGFSQMI